MEAMKDELSSMDKNSVWELEDLPPGRKVIGNKWVLKVQRKADGSIDKYKARFVVKRFTQQEGIMMRPFLLLSRLPLFTLSLLLSRNWI